jgi:hypothetical protein
MTNDENKQNQEMIIENQHNILDNKKTILLNLILYKYTNYQATSQLVILKPFG